MCIVNVFSALGECVSVVSLDRRYALSSDGLFLAPGPVHCRGWYGRWGSVVRFREWELELEGGNEGDRKDGLWECK